MIGIRDAYGEMDSSSADTEMEDGLRVAGDTAASVEVSAESPIGEKVCEGDMETEAGPSVDRTPPRGDDAALRVQCATLPGSAHCVEGPGVPAMAEAVVLIDRLDKRENPAMSVASSLARVRPAGDGGVIETGAEEMHEALEETHGGDSFGEASCRRSLFDDVSELHSGSERGRRSESPLDVLGSRLSPLQRNQIYDRVSEMRRSPSSRVGAVVAEWLNKLERDRMKSQRLQGAVSGSMKMNIRSVMEGVIILAERATLAERRYDEGARAENEGEVSSVGRVAGRRATLDRGTMGGHEFGDPAVETGYYTDDTELIGGGGVASVGLGAEAVITQRVANELVMNIANSVTKGVRDFLGAGLQTSSRGQKGTRIRTRGSGGPYPLSRGGRRTARGDERCWCRSLEDLEREESPETERSVDSVAAIAAGHAASCGRFVRRKRATRYKE